MNIKIGDKLHYILGYLLGVIMIVATIWMGYMIGSAVVDDYINNGIWSVILSFLFGIPVWFAMIYMLKRINFKMSK